MTSRILRYAHSATTVPCVGDNFDHLGWVFLCSDFATNYGYSCRQSEKFLLGPVDIHRVAIIVAVRYQFAA